MKFSIEQSPEHALGTTPSFEAEAGFTLYELLLIITVVGILLAMAVANIPTLTGIYGHRGAARQVYAELQNARMAAVMANRSYEFTVAGNRSYKVLGDQNNNGLFADPSEVTISRQIDSPNVTLSGSTVVFSARGNATTSGTVTVTDARGTPINITINPAGSIKINR